MYSEKIRGFFLQNERMVYFGARISYLFFWLFDWGNSERSHILGEIRPYTMVSYIRQKKLWELIDLVEQKGIKGNFVECGVWKGGSAGILAYRAQKEGKGRRVHLFDSFVGLPEPSKEDGRAAQMFAGKVVASLTLVKKLFFSILGLNKKDIFFYKGWFDETLSREKKKVGKIAILRIDADWYLSVKTCLNELYDAVIPGGFILFDDYGYWPGCKRAVDEFFRKKKNKPKLHKIDFSGVYIEK